MPKRILLENIKQHVKFEIATYAKKITNTAVRTISCYNLLNHMLHLFALAASQWYTMYYEIVVNITCNMIALFLFLL